MLRSVKGYNRDGEGGSKGNWGSVGCARDVDISSEYIGFGTGDWNYAAGRTKGRDQDSKQRDQEVVAIEIYKSGKGRYLRIFYCCNETP